MKDSITQNERFKYIYDLLKIDGQVTSKALSKDLSVSLMTIHRDLKEMEEQGYLKLVHGGAIYKNDSNVEYPMYIKKTEFVEDKKKIGQYANTLIEDGQNIFLETGSTTYFVARELINKKKSRFFSNSLLIINTLSRIDGLELHTIAGKYRDLSNGFTGVETILNVRGYNFDVCFIGTESIDLDGTVSLPNQEDSHTKIAILNQSNIKILVTDSTKFNKRSLYTIGNIKDFNYVITNLEVDSYEYIELKKLNKNLVTIKENKNEG